MLRKRKKQKRNSTPVRTVLVTGGAGFIGSNFLNVMVRKYPAYRFVNLDALTYAGNRKNLTVEDARNYSFVKTDIRDLKALAKVFKKHRPTHVIHFAAESHVDVSIKNPSIFIETNILGTHNLLLLAKEYGIQRFHHISTDEVYGSLTAKESAKNELAPLLPNSPYSASKAGADKLVRAYHKTYDLDTVITRSSNAYGPNQYTEKIIPLFLKNLFAKKKVPLYADGSNVREWLYVEDLVDGLDRAFHKGRAGEIYNLGASISMSNLALTKKLLNKLGRDETYIQRVADRPGHDFRYAVDSTKARRELGWKSTTSFEEGIEKTIEHYRRKFG